MDAETLNQNSYDIQILCQKVLGYTALYSTPFEPLARPIALPYTNLSQFIHTLNHFGMDLSGNFFNHALVTGYWATRMT